MLIDANAQSQLPVMCQNRAFAGKPLFSTREKSWRWKQVLCVIVAQNFSQTITSLDTMVRHLALSLLLVTLVATAALDVFWPPDGASVAPHVQQFGQQTL